MVELQLSQIEAAQRDRRRTDRSNGNDGDAVTTFVSISHWPILRLGTRWLNGIRQARSVGPHHVRTFPLDIHPSELLLRNAYDGTPHGLWIPKFKYPITFGSTKMVVISKERSYLDCDVLIPCNELFRAYYGTSSRLAYFILTGAFVYEGNNRIYDPSKSWLRDRVAFVQLGTRIRNSDAQQVARLAHDPIANAQTKAIIRDTIAASNAKRPYALAVKPPFRGHTDLEVRGIEIATRSRADGKWWLRFLVLEILGCTGPLPFDRVEFDRDNPGWHSVLHSAPERSLPTQRVRDHRDGVAEGAKIFEDDDPSAGDLPIDFIDVEAPPVYEIKPIEWKPAAEPAEPRSRAIFEREEPAGSFSGGRGTVRGSRTPAHFENTGAAEGQIDQPGTLAYFRAAVEVLPTLARETSIDLQVSFTISPTRWPKFLGPKIPWADIREDDASRPRRIAIASVVLESRAFVLMELERRPCEKLATLALFKQSHDPIETTALTRVILVLAKNHGNLDNEARWIEHRLEEIERRAIHHHRSNVPAGKYAARILARLANWANVSLRTELDDKTDSDDAESA